MEWHGRSEAVHVPGGIGAPGRKPGTAHGMKHRQCVLRIILVLSTEESPGGNREKHDTGGNREQTQTGSGGTSNENTVSR